MAVGYSAKLPIQESSDGSIIALNERLRDSIKQNVKMLMLTAPGERIMDVKFGVGLRRYFFRPMNSAVFDGIATKTREQLERYMPFLSFDGLQFATTENDANLAPNQIRIKVYYTIPSIGESDVASFIELSTVG